MNKILVGVDGSETSRAALRWAAGVARATGAELHAARVFESTEAELPPSRFTELQREQVHELEQWCEALPEGTPRAKEHLLDGDPADALLRTAYEQGADLLVVGGRGSGGFLRLHIGSVTHHLMHHANVPLVVVPPTGADNAAHVVLGVDGSANSLAAVDVGADLAASLGADVTAVHAFEPFLEWVPANDPNSWHRRAEDELREWVAPVEKVGVSLELNVERDVHPVAAISRAIDAHPGAIAVIGARGAGGFTGLRLGGIPLQLVHHTGAPVVVVPAAEGR